MNASNTDACNISASSISFGTQPHPYFTPFDVIPSQPTPAVNQQLRPPLPPPPPRSSSPIEPNQHKALTVKVFLIGRSKKLRTNQLSESFKWFVR